VRVSISILVFAFVLFGFTFGVSHSICSTSSPMLSVIESEDLLLLLQSKWLEAWFLGSHF
jgi:hypothetical protein